MSNNGSKVRVFFLAGQSNIQGNDEESQITNSSLLSAFSGPLYTWQIGPDGSEASTAIGQVQSFGDLQFGPELSMARALHTARTAGDVIALVKATKGSSARTVFAPDSGEAWVWLFNSYRQLCEGIRTQYPRHLIVPSAYCYSQGESEALSAATTEAAYLSTGLNPIAAGIRKLTAQSSLHVQLTLLHPDWPGDVTGEAEVRAAQESFVSGDSNASSINGDDLSLYASGPKVGHYDADGLVTLGERMAADLIAEGLLA